VSELGIRYRRSPGVAEGEPRLGRGPRAGDRLPDARVTLDGRATWLQEAVVGPHLTLLLCGDPSGWDAARLDALAAVHADVLRIRVLARGASAGALADAAGDALARLGVRDAAQYVVRPDGYVAFRCAGRDLAALERYLGRWLVRRRDERAR